MVSSTSGTVPVNAQDETVLPRPPESMRPFRMEVITAVGEGTCADLGSGVVIEWLVDAERGARNLSTGIVTCAVGGVLDWHRHHFHESVTLLDGAADLHLRDRTFRLDRLDNLVIPPGVEHRLANPSPDAPARLHVTYPTAWPTSSPGWRPDPTFALNLSSQVTQPAARHTPYATAHRYAAAHNAKFINHFNADLMSGMTMCGGYGLFQPGGRLPAHLHDFDESICIVQGTANCRVEGREYLMADAATALQPRGRVHYFINETDAPMAMVWVYAGPTTARTVVDERCATELGYAWR